MNAPVPSWSFWRKTLLAQSICSTPDEVCSGEVLLGNEPPVSPPSISIAPYAHLTHLLEKLPVESWPQYEDWNREALAIGVRNAEGRPISFIPPPKGRRLSALAFEEHIYHTGEVATREENWHDSFHALIWLCFPHSKAVINALHVREGVDISRANGRSLVRDFLTLFDEGGVIIISRQPTLTQLLRDYAWVDLFWQRRREVMRDMMFIPFGHALLEQSLKFFDGITGRGIFLTLPHHEITEEQILSYRPGQEWVDKTLAAWLQNPTHPLLADYLQPVPLKGIPGWSTANETLTYYLDPIQFRSKPRRSAE